MDEKTARLELKSQLKPVLAEDGFVPRRAAPRFCVTFARDLGPDVQTVCFHLSVKGKERFHFSADLASKLASVNRLLEPIDLPLGEYRYVLGLAGTCDWLNSYEPGTLPGLIRRFCRFWKKEGRAWLEQTRSPEGAREACLVLAREAFLSCHAITHLTRAAACSLVLDDREGAEAILAQAIERCLAVDPIKKGWEAKEAAAYLLRDLEWAAGQGLPVRVSEPLEQWLDRSMRVDAEWARGWGLDRWRERLG